MNEQQLQLLNQLDAQTALQLGHELTVILGIIAAWVAMDAKDRGWTRIAALSWGVGILFLFLPVLAAYVILRPRVKQKMKTEANPQRVCRYCDKGYPGDPSYCPHCSSQLKGADEIHKKS